MKETIIINLFGGPGISKSTTAALLFGKLKQMDKDCELVREYAKDLVWEERTIEFSNQMSIFGKQIKRINGVNGKVDYIVTDAPLLLSMYYNKELKEHFDPICLHTHGKYKNLNILLTRCKKYNPNGRFQTKEEAIEIDNGIKDMLDNNSVSYYEIKGDETATDEIIKLMGILLKDIRNEI